MFKENDFVVIGGNEIAIIKDGKVLFDDGMSMPYSEESNITLWEPKEGKYCWFNMAFDGVYDNPILMQYGEQDYTMWDIEPFLNKLPIFLKGTKKIDYNEIQEEKHCGVCIHFESNKYSEFFCKIGHTSDKMFNYYGQTKYKKSCNDLKFK